MSATSLKTITLSALFGAAAMASTASFAADMKDTKAMDKPAMEHCYGVAKAGKNDCAAAGHACAGQSSKDMDKASWVAVPAGVCAKLAGGSLTKG
jgi:uncharacterized membrane protein